MRPDAAGKGPRQREDHVHSATLTAEHDITIGARTATVSVNNHMVAAAIRATLAGSGWDTTTDAASLHITDRPTVRTVTDAPGARQVAVCEPTPFGARRGLDALTNLCVCGVVFCDDPADLEAVLAAIDQGRVALPLRLLSLAARMPQLTDRQLSALAAIAAGQSNSDIGRGLYLSATSVKREMAVLYSALQVATRPALTAAAFDLGIEARPVRP
jgi:DNA-binding CsgD family transcriptional regulator